MFLSRKCLDLCDRQTKTPKLSIYNNIKHTKSTNSLTGEAGTRKYCQSFFLSINLFSVDRCIRCWKDSGMSCCVRCCKHSGHAADQCGSEIALSSFMCHCLTSWGIWDIRFLNTQPNLRATGGSRKLTVSHKSRAPAPGEKTSGCFHEQHCLTSSHLSHSSISASPRAVWLFHHRSVEQ